MTNGRAASVSPVDPAWFVRGPGGIHGIGHVMRVRTHALALTEALGVEPRLARAIERAAAWHDIGRVDDGVDDHHGERSVARAIQLGLPAGEPEAVAGPALFAVRWHSRSDQEGLDAAARAPEPEAAAFVLKVLKDADGLDRVRIGDLDTSRLRFEASRARVAEAWRMLREPR